MPIKTIAVAAFPQDDASLAYAASDATILAVASGGGTLSIVDTANNGVLLDQFAVTGDVTHGLFTLAPDAETGTMIGVLSCPGLAVAIGHSVLAGLAGQPSGAFEDADRAGAFIGLSAGALTISGSLLLGGGIVAKNVGRVTQSGSLQIGDASGLAARLANRSGGTYALAGDVGIAIGSNAASAFNNNGGTLAKTAGQGTSVVAADLQDLNGAAAAISVASGTLQFNGSVNTFVSQTVTGAGTVAIGGAGASTIGAGTTLATNGFSILDAGTGVTLAENLAYAGSFGEASGTRLLINSGSALTLTGAASLSGATTGPGSLVLAGGTTTLNAGATMSTGAWTLTGSGTTATVATSLGFYGTFAQGVGTTLSLSGIDLRLRAAASFTGATIAGTGRLISRGATSIAGLTVGGNATLLNLGTATQTGGDLVLGDGSGGAAALVNGSTGTYTITDASDISGGTASSLLNQGLLQKTSATGVSIISVSATSTGTLANAGGNLVFDGPVSTLSGLYVGPGMIDYGPDGVANLGTIAMTAGACSTDLGIVNQSGVVTVGDISTVRTFAGATWNFTADVGLALAAGATTPSFTNWGTLAKTGGTGVSTVAIDATDLGTMTVSSGVLAFAGASNSVAGAIGGAGTMAFTGGTTSLASGTVLSVAGVAVSGSGTVLSIGTGLSYAGAFLQGAGTTLTLAGGDLHLSGTATLGGGTINGSGRLYTDGTAGVAGLTIGGTATLDDTGSLTQAGGSVTVGDGGSGAATLLVAAGATYSFADDSGIARGAAAGSRIVDQGLLQKTGGTGLSQIGVDIANTAAAPGTVAALSGILRLSGALSGNLALTVGTGATLVLDQAVGAGIAASFTGANATLRLRDAQDFHGTIKGFAGSATLDLRSIAYGSGTTMGFAAGMLTVSDGANTANLTLSGAYAASSFHLGMDAGGGTTVRVG